MSPSVLPCAVLVGFRGSHVGLSPYLIDVSLAVPSPIALDCVARQLSILNLLFQLSLPRLIYSLSVILSLLCTVIAYISSVCGLDVYLVECELQF